MPMSFWEIIITILSFINAVFELGWNIFNLLQGSCIHMTNLIM